VYVNGGKGGMPLCITVERGNTYQPVYPVLSLEPSKAIIALNFQGYSFYPCNIPVLIIELFYLISIFFAPHYVHPHEHGCPITAFGTTGTCRYLEYGRKFIPFRREHVLKFQFLQGFNGPIVMFLNIGLGHFTLFLKFKENLKIRY